MGEQLMAAVIGGFAGWAIIQAVAYFVVRSRLITYIVVQTNNRLQAAHGNREWLQQLCNDHSTIGVVAQVAPRYSPDHAEDLHESRELMLRYLWKDEIERITKFLSYLWEVEYLTEGVCDAIGSYARSGKPLAAADCQYLKSKVGRVTSIVAKWPQSIKALDELPMDYAGVMGPSSVTVPPRPQTASAG